MRAVNELPMAIPTIAPVDKDVEPSSPDADEGAALPALGLAVELDVVSDVDVAVAVRNTLAFEGSSSTLAAKRSSFEQPSLQGFEAQHPMNGGSALEQVYHELELYGESQFSGGIEM